MTDFPPQLKPPKLIALLMRTVKNSPLLCLELLRPFVFRSNSPKCPTDKNASSKWESPLRGGASWDAPTKRTTRRSEVG